MESGQEKSKDIVGVILAAGRGSRMGLLPSAYPKPVLPILNKPIVYHQLETMARLGIKKVFMVVGFQGFMVVREIERLPGLGLDIQYIPQEQTLGIAHCVGQLEPYIDAPFLMFLGDIYFHAPRMDQMIQQFSRPGVDGVLGALYEDDEAAIRKNFAIIQAPDGRVARVIEKPRYPKTKLKGAGLYLFSPVVFDAIRRTPRTAMRDEYEITDSMQIMIDDGCRLEACTCIEADLNVTFPMDLLDINLRLLDQSGRDSLVHESARLGQGAVVEHSVCGEGVVIGENARVSNSVLFAHVRVQPGAVLDQVILTDQGVYKR